MPSRRAGRVPPSWRLRVGGGANVTVVARAWRVVSGVVAAVLGSLLLAASAMIALTFGTDGTLSAAPVAVKAAGVALLVDDLTVDAIGVPLPDGVGVLTLSASSSDGAPVFLGLASGPDLDSYLAGAPYDVVAELASGGTTSTRVVPGSQRPLPPSTQQFWLRQDEGAPAELTARVPAGTTVVLMRADATPGIAAALTVRLEVDRSWPAALVIGGAGIVLLAVGVAVLLGARRRTASTPSGAHSVSAATVLPGSPGGAASEDVSDG